MTRRITRAKQAVKDTELRPPSRPGRNALGTAVLHVLYLIFNEGYATTSGPDLQRAELATEAIRLARVLHRTAARRRRGGRPAGPDAAHRRPPAGAHPVRTGSWSPWPNRTARSGTATTSPRVRAADGRAAARPDRPLPAPGRDRRPPRRGPNAPRTPTGRRSAPCTSCCCGSPRQPGGGPEPRGGGGHERGAVRAGLAALASIEPVDHRLTGVRAHLLELAGDLAARAAYLETASEAAIRAARRARSTSEQGGQV